MSTAKLKRYLLVDDSKMARMFIKRCMEISLDEEFECMEAANGLEAQKVLNQHAIDVVVADLNMPEMNGEDLLIWIRKQEQFKTLPVIFVTSVKNLARETKLSLLGAKAILGKPVSPEELGQVLKSITN